MAINKLPPVDYLRQVFDYTPETGQLIWKRRPWERSQWNNRCAGKKAGHVRKDGREVVSVNGVLYYSSRIIWAILNGEDCEAQIDHVDLDKNNNLPENIRTASHAQNNANKGLRKDNTTGLKGICYVVSRKAFLAQLVVNKKRVLNKYFKTAKEAETAYREAAEQYNGAFARTK